MVMLIVVLYLMVTSTEWLLSVLYDFLFEFPLIFFYSFLGKIKMFDGVSKSTSLLARDKAPHIWISPKPRPYFSGIHNRHHLVFPHKS